MTTSSQAQSETEKKGHLFPEDTRDLSSTSLKDYNDSIDRSLQTDDQLDKSHKHKMRLIHELTTGKDRAASEYEMREKAQKESNQLKKTIQEMQMDNQKLERHIQEWKLVAVQASTRANAYCKGLRQIWAPLEEVKSTLNEEERPNR